MLTHVLVMHYNLLIPCLWIAFDNAVIFQIYGSLVTIVIPFEYQSINRGFVNAIWKWRGEKNKSSFWRNFTQKSEDPAGRIKRFSGPHAARGP